ncbi:MAG TPA: ATP-dependent RNA helicase RhlE, partial [Methylococcaceae bacterium]|nr:ATP-dependent RNA helicase RhlE [Methylococcaceae bacterium]
DRNRKQELLSHLIGSQDWRQVLVFTRTKHGANKLAEKLERDGIGSAAIHGNKSQAARTKALADFKSGAIRALVATDIAARGLDIDQLPHVVNYELPNIPEDYVHRIGRTGRAGNAGEAISLVCVDEHNFLRDIERLIKRDINKIEIEGFQPDPSIKPEPVFKQRQQRSPRSGNDARNNGQRNNGNPSERQATKPARSKPRRGNGANSGSGRPQQGRSGQRRLSA